MLIILSLIYLLNEVTSDAINVAKNKTTKYCGTMRMSNKIVDGIVNVADVDVQTATCPAGRSFVEVSLGHEYYIHYAIVYEGIAPANQAGTMDYFQVECRHEDTHVYYCSLYPKLSVGPTSEGMRINCRTEKCDAIRLYSQKNIGLAVAEFEVYTLANLNLEDGINVNIYYGCYENLQTMVVFSPLASLTTCLDNCRRRLVPLAGILDNTGCKCGTLIDAAVNLPDNKCNRRCGDKPCGGDGAYSVYIVNIQLPYYYGCHLLDEAESSRGQMTLQKCIKACSNNFLSAIKNGNECACTLAIIDPDYFDYILCNMPCTGDASLMCGGPAHYSVFDDSLSSEKIKMSTLFKCSGIWNQHGICQGNCSVGYFGPYCIEYSFKDCEVDRPCAEVANSECSVTADHQYACNCISGFFKNEITEACEVQKNCEIDRPCAEIANSVCSVTADNQYACNCISGFRKNEITGICEDTAEKNCEIDMPCAGIENSECSITASNQYECNCKHGFLKNVTTESCEDIDECFKDDACGHGTTGCINTMGSYRCDCLPGYIGFTDIVCLKNGTQDHDIPFSIPTMYFVVPSLLSFLIFGAAMFIWFRSKNSISVSSSNPSTAS